MNEKEELEIKNSLVYFIRTNFEVEGDPILVDKKIVDLSIALFDLFLYFYTQKPKKFD